MSRDQIPDAPPATRGEAQERRLLAGVAAGDRRAFEQLYFLYRPRLTRFLARMMRHESVADAVVNDVLYTVWKRAHTFAGRSRVSTWVFGIAYRTALKALRKQRVRALLFLDDSTIQDRPDVDSFQLDEQAQWLGHGLDTLSPRQRAVVELCYFGGYDYKEIAAIVNCPVNTVKTRMFNARRKLKAVLPTLAGDGTQRRKQQL